MEKLLLKKVKQQLLFIWLLKSGPRAVGSTHTSLFDRVKLGYSWDQFAQYLKVYCISSVANKGKSGRLLYIVTVKWEIDKPVVPFCLTAAVRSRQPPSGHAVC